MQYTGFKYWNVHVPVLQKDLYDHDSTDPLLYFTVESYMYVDTRLTCYTVLNKYVLLLVAILLIRNTQNRYK